MSLLQSFQHVAAQQLEAKRLADKNPLEAIELLDSTAETVAAETALPKPPVNFLDDAYNALVRR